MKISEAMELFNIALADIGEAEGQIGNARQEDTATILAQIAQAKLLAVVAGMLIKYNQDREAEIDREEIRQERDFNSRLYSDR